MSDDTTERDAILARMSGWELAEYVRRGGVLPGRIERQRRAEAIASLKARELVPGVNTLLGIGHAPGAQTLSPIQEPEGATV